MTAVLDASAVLALLFAEPGWAGVKAYIQAAAISSVNYCEVVGRMSDAGVPDHLITSTIADLGLDVIAFDRAAAFEAGKLRPMTRDYGLSLGDRACLATAKRLSLPVVTADRVWANLDLGIEIRLIR